MLKQFLDFRSNFEYFYTKVSQTLVREVLQGEEMYKESFYALFFKGKATEFYYIRNATLFIIEQKVLDEIKALVWVILFKISAA